MFYFFVANFFKNFFSFFFGSELWKFFPVKKNFPILFFFYFFCFFMCVSDALVSSEFCFFFWNFFLTTYHDDYTNTTENFCAPYEVNVFCGLSAKRLYWFFSNATCVQRQANMFEGSVGNWKQSFSWLGWRLCTGIKYTGTYRQCILNNFWAINSY